MRVVSAGTSALVSVNNLISITKSIAGVKMRWTYNLTAPQGVGGRNSDDTFVKQVLRWEPSDPLKVVLRITGNGSKDNPT